MPIPPPDAMLDGYSEDHTPRGRSPGPSSNHVHFRPEVSSHTSLQSTSNSRSSSTMTSPLSLDLLKPDQPRFEITKTLDNVNPSDSVRTTHESESHSGKAAMDDESAVAEPFERVPSSNSEHHRVQGAAYEKVGDRGVTHMHRFSLYETASRYYLVGADTLDSRYRILKIDRNADEGELSITEDEIVYNKLDMGRVLNAIDDGNKASGGLKLKGTTWGILGFIKFTGAYYMLSVVRRKQIAMIGGHYIYQIEETDLIPLTLNTPSRFKPDVRNTEEARFLSILNTLDLHRSFYYSYSYDITQTLQHNMIRERKALTSSTTYQRSSDYNTMFVWNQYLLEPAIARLKSTFDWCQPIIHGYIDQAALSIFGRTIHVAVIARRSRYFAGARFLKRGVNDMGHVANDVETEQIVADAMTTSFHGPGNKLFTNPNFTSYVQHRGSIPLHWTQDNTGVTPKPPIQLNLVDPFYSAAALHFDDLFRRYGGPIYVLNLVKAKERTPRESKLLEEFTDAINYLNQFLPQGKRIIHTAWDMSRASKSRDQDVIGTLEAIAEDVMHVTGFFRNGDGKTSKPRMQNGIARTNCIDCLDRTNAAQFVIGKRALGHQLYALGVIDSTSIDYDTDAVNLFTHMFHDHGDTIAVQYGGSQLVNTMETYRKINQWTSHSRDMVESFKRYYNNSFLDGQRQEAYNLFLGNYTYQPGQPLLWELVSDYHLHHLDSRHWYTRTRRGYQEWFTPTYLVDRELPHYSEPVGKTKEKPVVFFDDYWLEYYRPLTLSSFPKVFSYKMNSTSKYIPPKPHPDVKIDLSPFKIRTDSEQDTIERKKFKKEVTIVDPVSDISLEAVSSNPDRMLESNTNTKHIWHQPPLVKHVHYGIMKDSRPMTHSPTSTRKLTQLDKTKAAQGTFTYVVYESLNPSVSPDDEEDYTRYISHPQNLPLVTSIDAPNDIVSEYLDYVSGSHELTTQPQQVSRDDLTEYEDFLAITENALTVTDDDGLKKRYKAYRKWLRGKSLFKQQPVD